MTERKGIKLLCVTQHWWAKDRNHCHTLPRNTQGRKYNYNVQCTYCDYPTDIDDIRGVIILVTTTSTGESRLEGRNRPILLADTSSAVTDGTYAFDRGYQSRMYVVQWK